MLASSTRQRPQSSTELYSTRRKSVVSGVTSELISQLAVIALKIRLEGQSSVQCKVNTSTWDMVSGKVGPVTVKGKGWVSPLGLTCRAIEATVQECSLDLAKVVKMRKLHLIVPAKGDAMIALNPRDFGNFITHPLLKPPTLIFEGQPNEISFMKDNVVIDASEGTVYFQGKFMEFSLRLALSRGGQNGNTPGANVKVNLSENMDITLDDDTKKALERDLSHLVSKYFTDIVFELDGTFLSFSDMMVTDKGKLPCVMLALAISVRKFPSPGVAF